MRTNSHDDRIEFYNQGGLYGDITLKELLSFNYKSQTRNKLIAKAFKEIGIIEKYGSGIKRIFSICKNHGIISPIINTYNNGFEIVLFKEKTDQKTDQKKIVTNLMKENPNITIREIANIIGKGQTVTKKIILELKKTNKILRIGPDKGGYWEVLNE